MVKAHPSWVLAYGSNMHLGDLHRWLAKHDLAVASPLRVEPARLDGFRLAWNYYSEARQGAAANVVPDRGASIYGVALQVDAGLLAALDAKEGHPQRYCRGDVPRVVHLLAGGDVDAWVYEVQPDYLRTNPVWPRRAYLDLMLEAAADHGLPAAWIAVLQAVPTCD